MKVDYLRFGRVGVTLSALVMVAALFMGSPASGVTPTPIAVSFGGTLVISPLDSISAENGAADASTEEVLPPEIAHFVRAHFAARAVIARFEPAAMRR